MAPVGTEPGGSDHRGSGDRLPRVRAALAVCAHPDDESFGLGAVLAGFAQGGAALSLVCFTRGEASTLGGRDVDLTQQRTDELSRASGVLGVSQVSLLDHADGHLTEVPLATLVDEVGTALAACRPELVLVFDEGGVTGHPDHRRATEAAMAATAATGLPVLAWSVAAEVAATLNRELGTEFIGRPFDAIDLAVQLDRARQLQAIRCHASQSADNPVLTRRLELQGDREVLRWLRPPVGNAGRSATGASCPGAPGTPC